MTSITTNTTLTAQALSTYTDNYQWTGQPNCAPLGTFGPDRTYRVSIPGGQRLTVAVTPNGAWNPSIQLTVGCMAGSTNTCLAGINSAGDNAVETLLFNNGGSSTVDAFVLVDTSSSVSAVTAFDISFAFTAVPAGETCGNADVVTLPLSRPSEVLANFANDYASGAGCATGTNGADRVYQLTVPGNSRLAATATASTLPDGGVSFNPTVNIVTSATCSSVLSCATGAAGTNGQAASTFDNIGTNASSVFVVVDTSSASPGTFALNLSASSQTYQAGDTCSNAAAPITTSTMLTGESFTNFTNNFGGGNEGTTCFFDDGPDRVYAVTVPSMTRLTVNATSASANLSLSTIDGLATACSANPVTCGARADATSTGAEVMNFDNATGSSKTVFVVVDRRAGTITPDTFDIGFGFAAVPSTVNPGVDCASPVSISANGTIVADFTARANTYSFVDTGLCAGVASASTAPDGVYSVTIPVNSRLTVRATANWDLVLNAVDSPASNCGTGMGTGIVCLAGADSTSSGNETITVDNPSTTSTRTVFLLLDGYSTTSTGSLELQTSTAVIPPPAYTKTTIPAACETLSSPVVLLDSTTTPTAGDEAASATTALPIAFNFFGAPVTHFAADTNGLMHFLASSAVAVPDYFNANIPNSATPNGFAAPFWDDQNSVATTSIRYATIGTAPNRRMVLEWFDSIIYAASTSNLGYQVKLYETTNVIEFHYCTLTAGSSTAARVSGGSATVGLENATGSAGALHSYNTASSVDTTNALRFTP